MFKVRYSQTLNLAEKFNLKIRMESPSTKSLRDDSTKKNSFNGKFRDSLISKHSLLNLSSVYSQKIFCHDSPKVIRVWKSLYPSYTFELLEEDKLLIV